jgi:hypothetical protein
MIAFRFIGARLAMVYCRGVTPGLRIGVIPGHGQGAAIAIH